MSIRRMVVMICVIGCIRPIVGKAQLPGIFIDPTAEALRGVAIPGLLFTEGGYLRPEEQRRIDEVVKLQKKYLDKRDKITALSTEYLAIVTGMIGFANVTLTNVKNNIQKIRTTQIYLKHFLYPIESDITNLADRLQTIEYYMAGLLRANDLGGDGPRIIFYQEMCDEIMKINTKLIDHEYEVNNLLTLNEILLRKL